MFNDCPTLLVMKDKGEASVYPAEIVSSKLSSLDLLLHLTPCCCQRSISPDLVGCSTHLSHGRDPKG